MVPNPSQMIVARIVAPFSVQILFSDNQRMDEGGIYSVEELALAAGGGFHVVILPPVEKPAPAAGGT
jgi:hypothetical protein